ncbi:MAG: VWA domain-containing protein [Fidelibacterota bacterium]
MVELAHPWYLLMGLIIPIYYYSQRYLSSRQGSLQFSDRGLFAASLIRKGNRKIKVLRSLELLILALIIMGLTGPRLSEKLQETSVEVVDIILAVDISSSMLAEDFKPNRLEAVKETALAFIDARPQDRIGILVFAGEPFIQCPLTVDKAVLKDLLREITIAEKEYDGTAIGMVLANATNRLRHSEAKSKIVILLSDGSNNAGELDPLSAADLAAQFGVKVYTIGAGTNQSRTLIPGRGYIINEIDEETLREIAKRTGGKYFRARDVQSLENIYREIDQLERTEIDIKEFNLYRELYGWFLIPAMVLGMLHRILNRVWRRRLNP